jgi:opacity protein-like surface antigen
MNHASYRVAGLMLLTLGAALPVHAQDERKVEISAGYQLLTFHEEDVDVDETLGKGWYADVAGNIGPLFAAVFQVSGNYKSYGQDETFDGNIRAVVDAQLNVHTYMTGVRVGPRHAKISPYGEFLVGGVTGSVEITSLVTSGGQTIFSSSDSESGTEFAMQFGGGVTIWLNERIGVRGAVGYLRVMGDGDGNVVRVAGGVSFGF